MREVIEIPEVKLTWKQKIILKALQEEFGGRAFGPQMLAETENEDLKSLNINSLTWNILRLRESELVESEKKVYEGRVLNEYRVSPYIIYDVVKIK